jgi:hypothetical protein
MVVNQGKKRAKEKRKLARRKERAKAKVFGTFVTDKAGNKRISLD